jgi:hypothetical protein
VGPATELVDVMRVDDGATLGPDAGATLARGVGRLEMCGELGAFDGRGRELGTVLERLRVETGAGGGAVPFMIDSLILLAAVWRTLGVFLRVVVGAGRALKDVFLSVSRAVGFVVVDADRPVGSFFILSSRAALSFAATASPGSWK